METNSPWHLIGLFLGGTVLVFEICCVLMRGKMGTEQESSFGKEGRGDHALCCPLFEMMAGGLPVKKVLKSLMQWRKTE